MVAVLIGVLGVFSLFVGWYQPGGASVTLTWACSLMGAIAVYFAAVLWWGRFPAEHNHISRRAALSPDYTPHEGAALWQHATCARTVSFGHTRLPRASRI